jgi:O-antigen/teichoic acid export membrane protein
MEQKESPGFLARYSGLSEGFVPSVVTLVSGSGGALAIAYLARPILTRVYTPDEYGLLGFFVAVVALLVTISAGRYDDALMQPESDRDARSLLALCGIVMAGVFGASFLFLIFRTRIADFFGKPEAAPYLALVPIALLAGATIRISETWLTRKKRFRQIASARLAQSGTMVPAQLIAGVRGAGPAGLVGGMVFGQVAAATVLVLGATRFLRALRTFRVPLPEIKTLADRYRDFPLFGAPSALLNVASVQLPAILLFYYFDASVVGLYAQGYGLLAVPIGVVGSSVAQVYFVSAAEARRQNRLQRLTTSVYSRLVLLGLFPVAALILAGPDILEFVLGQSWREAGTYVQFLGAWLFFVFLSSPLSRLFDVLEKQRLNLAFNVVLFVTRAASLIVGGILGNPILAIALFGITGAVLWFFHTMWMLQLGGVPLRHAVGPLLRYGTVALPLVVVLWLVRESNVHIGWIFLATIALAGIYYLISWRLDRHNVPAGP